MAAAKKTATATATATAPAPIVDGFLSAVTEDELGPRTRRHKDNPLEAHLRLSYENGKTLGVTVTGNGKDAVNMIRRAANALDIGVTIDVDDLGNGTSRVKFAGRDRREYKARAPRA